jgi:hypothetical protein
MQSILLSISKKMSHFIKDWCMIYSPNKIHNFHLKEVFILLAFSQILEKAVSGSMPFDWIDLAHDRDWWRALVNAVMNLQVP